MDGIMQSSIGQAAVAAAAPGIYQRDVPFAAKAVSVAADRSILLTPNRLAVDLAGSILSLTSQAALDLSLAATWDATSPTDYTVAANRAGKDFYVYACNIGGTIRHLVSANATTPTGYTALTSRKVAGFHCFPGSIRHDLTLTAWVATTAIAVGVTRKSTTWDGHMYRCSTAGTTGETEPDWSSNAVGAYVVDGTVTWIVEQHTLEGYVAGDIMPSTVWDLRHRHPISNDGAFWDANIRKWAMIYLPSWKGGKLVSANGGTIADGASVWGAKTGFSYLDFCEQLALIGYRPPTQHEFMSLSDGSNQGTNVAGGADPVATGPHIDTSGRSIVSKWGGLDFIGVMWQWGIESGGPYAGATWVEQYVAAKTAQMGSGYNVPNRALFGGSWSDGTTCGSRSSSWYGPPTYVFFKNSARGVSDTLAVSA